MKKKITVPDIMACKGGSKVPTMITCYDYTNAQLVDESNIDMILVGDSLGMTMLGYKGTVGVTVEDIIRNMLLKARQIRLLSAICLSAHTM